MKLIKKNTLYIYTDGSCLPKPRKGGIGIRFVYIHPGDPLEENQIIDVEENGFKGASNNQMELYACIEGLRQSRYLNIDISYNLIEIRTDSRYVSDNYKRALYTWPGQKWLNKHGKPFDNVELWQKFAKEAHKVKCRLEITWLKGHSDDENNKAVDRIAKKSARTALNSPLFIVTQRRKKSTEKTKIGSIVPKGQKIGLYIISSQVLREQRINKYRCEVIEEGSDFFKKVDFLYSELFLGDAHTYEVVLNSNPKNPRIVKLLREIGKPKNPSAPYIKALTGIQQI